MTWAASYQCLFNHEEMTARAMMLMMMILFMIKIIYHTRNGRHDPGGDAGHDHGDDDDGDDEGEAHRALRVMVMAWKRCCRWRLGV